MKKRTNLLALVLSITAITFTLLGCSSDTGQKKSIVAPGSATEAGGGAESSGTNGGGADQASADESINEQVLVDQDLSLIHISEPTRQAEISYAVFCLKKKKNPQK